MLSVRELTIDVRPTYAAGRARGELTPLVRDVTFAIPTGESLALVGETGAGKSVTAHAILGLLPAEFRVRGARQFNGRDIDPDSGRGAERVRTFMVLQDAATSLNPSMTIGRQMAELAKLPAVRRSLGRESARDAMIRVMKEVGLPDPALSLKRYPYEFSGGMRQRIVIAMALLARVELIIADEPTSSLDSITQRSVLTVLNEVQRRHHLTMLLITHDLRVVIRVCSRIAVMFAGRIVEEGPVADVLAAPEHPYTKLLRDADPILGGPSLRGDINDPGPATGLVSAPGCPFAYRCERRVEQCEIKFPAAQEHETSRTVYCWNGLSRLA